MYPFNLWIKLKTFFFSLNFKSSVPLVIKRLNRIDFIETKLLGSPNGAQIPQNEKDKLDN